MTTKDEALKQLRVALEDLDSMEPLGPTTEAVIDAAQQWYLAEQPAQQRPQNCGTGYCSCIECPCEQPAQQHYQSTADKCELTPVPAKGGLLPAQQQEPVSAIRALTDQCAALIQERDELQKQVWRYEKNGVTCQTYRHKIDRTCSECNVQEDYTSPQPAQQEPVAYAVYHRMGGSKTLHWPEQHSEDGDHNEYQLVPLYTSPPIEATPLASQSRSDVKPWVGLTKEERVDFTLSCGSYETVCSIEAKLKAKNSQ